MSAQPELAPVVLRPMRGDDIYAVMRVEHAAYAHPWTEGIFRDCLRVGYCCWVGEHGGEVMAHLVLSVAAGESHLLNLCVAPTYQWQGLGRRLLRQALHLAREHGAARLYLEVRPSNAGALALYRKSGFTQLGVRRGYYPGPDGMREDAVVLGLDL